MLNSTDASGIWFSGGRGQNISPAKPAPPGRDAGYFLASASGLMTLTGLPAAKARTWSKIELNADA